MKEILFVFPGQGSQQVGMAADFMQHPATKPLFEQADDVLDFKFSQLMAQGDAATLALTVNTQPALFLAAAAAVTYWQQQSGNTVAGVAAGVAGHSLGEYSALWAAGVLDFTTTLKLVRLRAQAMQRAVPVGEGAMAALLGAPLPDVVQSWLAEECWIANDNSPGQVVISGRRNAVAKSVENAQAAGIKRAVVLDVSGPFHCPLMQPAVTEMAEALADIEFRSPSIPVISNISASLQTNAETLKNGLLEQLVSPVRWRESMQSAAQNGFTRVIEWGSGKVLSGLAKRCDERLQVQALTNRAEVDDFIMQQQAGVAA